MLNEKTAKAKEKNNMKKGTKDKTGDKDTLKVKADCFGADLDASTLRSSRNVKVLFHMRRVCLLIITTMELPWQRPVVQTTPFSLSAAATQVVS